MPDSLGSRTLGHNHVEERKEGGSGNPQGTEGIARACLEMGNGVRVSVLGDLSGEAQAMVKEQRDMAGVSGAHGGGRVFPACQHSVRRRVMDAD